MTILNPTQRFSDRVKDYIKYRPDYPEALFTHLVKHCGLTADHIVADIGSGTGLLTKHFLDRGHQIYAVEPNTPMRSAAESLLHAYPQFQSISGQAEATTLANASVDWIVAGQAFHWFDQEKTRLEFERILKPGGHVALIWNDRIDEIPFHQDYEEFLQTHCPDYKKVNHRRVSRRTLEQFFTPLTMEMATFEHEQIFDFDGLRGRLLSCSYAPKPDAPNYGTMITALKHLFDRHGQNDQIVFPYQTKLFHFSE
ncbi:MAG: class I SAM-dependent methyltransferase [Cyanobacteria bacterium P01_F01_bin.116]